MVLKWGSMVFFVGAILAFEIITSEDVSWGGKCSEDLICDAMKGLECNNAGICTCGKENETYWDMQNSACKSFHEAPCTVIPKPGQPFRGCTAHAQCSDLEPDGTGTCRCDPLYIPGETLKFCYGSYNASCQSTSCSSSAFLTCDYDTLRCSCDLGSNQQVWSSASRMCVSLIGGSCERRGNSNRTCVDSERSECSDNICKCMDLFKAYDGNQRCVGTFNANCSDNTDCLPSLTCNNGKCGCTDNENQDPESDKCVVKAGKSCESNENCASNSLCNPDNKTCTCQPTFILKEDTCRGGFGSGCSTNPLICSTEDFYECQNATCNCIAPTHMYDETKKRCVGFYNSTCTENEGCDSTLTCNMDAAATTETSTITTPSITTEPTTVAPVSDSTQADTFFDYYIDPYANGICGCTTQEEYDTVGFICRVIAGASCENNGNCVANSQCDSTNKNCTCLPTFIQTPAGACMGGFGSNCTATESVDSCYAEDYLKCGQDNSCVCADGYTHSEGRCIGRVGSKCRADNDCQSTTMSCSEEKVCACKSGFASGTDNACYALHGTGCSDTVPCFATEYLGCFEGYCNCENQTTMTYENEKCVGLATMPCIGNQLCIANSTCNADSATCQCNDGFVADEAFQCVGGAKGLQVFALLILSSLMVTMKF